MLIKIIKILCYVYRNVYIMLTKQCKQKTISNLLIKIEFVICNYTQHKNKSLKLP